MKNNAAEHGQREKIANIKELLDMLTRNLDSGGDAMGMAGSMPAIPMMLLYGGSTAAENGKVIKKVLKRAWRKRADAIEELIWTPNAVDAGELQKKIDSMYMDADSFAGMENLLLCFIFEASDFSDFETFRQKYEVGDTILGLCSQFHPYVMGIVLLDESMRGKSLSDEIKSYLREKLKSQEMLYSPLVLLSNRMYNGALLGSDRQEEIYELMGNLLLLVNSKGDEFSPCLGMLFPPERELYYLTASYTNKRKPNRKICEVMMNVMLELAKEEFSKDKRLSLDDLKKILDIKNGWTSAAEEYFKKRIIPQLPGEEILELLPKKTMALEKNTTYDSLNRQSMGCAELLCDRTFQKIAGDASEDFAQILQAELPSKIKAGEARTIDADVAERVLSFLDDTEPEKFMEPYDYMKRRAESVFRKNAAELYRRQLKELRTKAEEYARQLEMLRNDFLNIFFTRKEDERIRNYYEALTRHYFEMHGEAWRTFEAAGEEDAAQAIFNILKSSMEEIFQCDPIFQKSLEEEMAERMGVDMPEIHKILGTELTNKDEASIYLRTRVVPVRLGEFFILNQKDENRQNTRFFEYLKNFRKEMPDVRFLDSGNKGTVKVLRLYRVGENEL